MAYTITSPEWLEVAGVPLSTPAWETTDASELWSSPEVRGADLLLPGAVGVRPYPRRATVTPVTVELAVVGDTDWEGNPYAEVRAGLATNCRHLQSLADRSAAAPDGTVTATLHYAPGAPVASIAGPVHVLRLRFARQGPNLATGQLELSIPAGALT